MYALIEPTFMKNNLPIVVDVSGKKFTVADPLYWVSCPENIFPMKWVYDESNKKFISLETGEIKEPPL